MFTWHLTEVQWNDKCTRDMTHQPSLIHTEREHHGYWSSSERDTKRLWYGYRISPKGDRKWSPRLVNSLLNGIRRDSRDNHQEQTEISQRRISLLKDFTWRSRGLPGALLYQATDRDTDQMPYLRIKNYRPMAYRTECGTIPPNDYWEANRYSTEAVYWWPREVDQECTEAIIRLASTEKRSTETLPDAESRDAGNPIWKAAFPEQKRAPIAVSMTTYCEAYVLDMDQWYTATLMQWALSTILKWSPVSHITTNGCDNARS